MLSRYVRKTVSGLLSFLMVVSLMGAELTFVELPKVKAKDLVGLKRIDEIFPDPNLASEVAGALKLTTSSTVDQAKLIA